jgi:VanZ family protein
MSNSAGTTGQSAGEAPTPPRPHPVRHQLSAWLPVLVCIFVISQESTAAFGADRTSGPLQHFFEYFFGHFTQPEWWRLHIFLRKVGHFTGYGLLSASWFRAFWMTYRPSHIPSKRRLGCHELAMAGTFVIACCDEFHQLFLPNRTGSFWDVMVDCSGALLVQSIIWFSMRKRFQP